MSRGIRLAANTANTVPGVGASGFGVQGGERCLLPLSYFLSKLPFSFFFLSFCHGIDWLHLKSEGGGRRGHQIPAGNEET